MTGEIQSRSDLIRALTRAAEIEHAAICQYMFAAASLKKRPEEGACGWPQVEAMRQWQSTLLLLARQEMEHLGAVCNLLSAVGGLAHFGRPPLPGRVGTSEGAPWFSLEPFSLEALGRFLAFERSHAATPSEGGDEVGGLYRRILGGLESLDRGRDLWVGPRKAQVTNHSLDLPPGWYGVDLLPVRRLADARAVVGRILEAGDGEADRAPGHTARLEGMLRELEVAREQDPTFEPARPVVANPVTVAPLDPQTGTRLIEHPVTARMARLFNEAYEVMLLMLVQFHTPREETPGEWEGLRRIAFFPLMTMVLRPVGEILTTMPLREGSDAPTAGPPFEIGTSLAVPPYKRSAWLLYHERLERLAAEGVRIDEELARRGEGWARSVAPRVGFLRQSLAALSAAFDRYVDIDTVRSLVMMDQLLADEGP